MGSKARENALENREPSLPIQLKHVIRVGVRLDASTSFAPANRSNTLRIVVIRAICIVGLLASLASPARAQTEEQLIADVKLFTVMTAINVGGYDDGLNAEAVSPVRIAVRKELDAMDRGMRSRLRTFYEQHQQGDPEIDLSQYISFALMCGEPPYFDLKAEVPTDLPVDVRAIRGMSALLREFYEVADIESLWDKYRPAYEAEMLRYQDALIEAVYESL